jgi:cobalt-zinc-cadmium efflux system protein
MSHAHHHHEQTGDFGRAFGIGIGLNAAFIAVETIGGFYAGSLALLADAGHNFGDVLGLMLAWGATVLARRVPTERRTYGLRRSSILVALLNALLLVAVVGGIAWEAIERLFLPEPPPGATVIWIAAIGVVINAVSAIFFRGGEHDVNVRGAYLHLAADALVSLGVVAAGIVIQYTHWTWLDPATSLVIAAVVLFSTWHLLRESLDLALDAVPRNIEPQAVHDYLQSLPGAVEVHDLHIWGLSTTEVALTAHLVLADSARDDELLATITGEIYSRFGIEHVTVQIEGAAFDSDACRTACQKPADPCADHDHA